MLRQFVGSIESGAKTPVDLRDICLRRIAECEPEIRAWVEVEPRVVTSDGPLRGVPFGVKDVFEIRGMATEYGSPLFAGQKGNADAALVAYLCDRGAMLMGKTATAAFAYFDPPATRNPRAPGRTPGGSSSGSAAAVAAGMVPFALGTQTQGSVIRPAAFCGVTGFKPTFGRLPLEGVLRFAPTLDTAGLFTQTAADMQLLWHSAGWGEIVDPPGWDWRPFLPPAFSPREFWFEELAGPAAIVNEYEGARTHRELWERHGEAIGLKLAALVSSGLRMPEENYRAALVAIQQARETLAAIFRVHPLVFTPAAPGPAPEGLMSTGDPHLNAPWTALGCPVITVPLPGADPPLGVQIAATPGEDDLLLAAAVEVERWLNA